MNNLIIDKINEKDYIHLHLFYYHTRYKDNLTNNIIRYKNGDKELNKKLSKIAIEKLNMIIGKRLPKFDLIIRALGHNELVTEYDHPLDKLARNISAGIGVEYNPTVLYKKDKNMALHLIKDEYERYDEIKKVYEFNGINLSTTSPNILIIDDVYTLGSTALVIAEGLKDIYINPKVYIFTLAKVERENYKTREVNDYYYNLIS